MDSVKTKRKRAKQGVEKERQVSRLRRPVEMSLDEWQLALRRQFGAEQNFN